MTTKAARVLFVDDDATFRKVMTRELAGFGYEVQALASAEGLATALAEFRPHVMLLDLRLPGADGFETLQSVLSSDPELPVIMLTGHGAVPEAVRAMRKGAFDFLTKPASLDLVDQTLRKALERQELRGENRRLRALTERGAADAEILGNSPAIEEVRRLIARVAPSGHNVLVLGENGTGKELVARSLHRQGARGERAFVAVNCGAVADDLIEAELFGHERGSFTGASRQRIGLFEAADGGTLFLDEVGELSLAVQPALLRVLQFGEIRPVGSERTRHADVTVISATNRDLLAEVERGGFREDVYYRLATITIRVPPLRERLEDIEVLANAALKAVTGSGPSRRFDTGALDRLRRHAWPGNVRELENVVRRLCLLVSGEVITATDVQAQLTERSASASGQLPTLDLEELERLAVAAALKRHPGNKRAAAAELGVALKTLYNKIARYELRGS